MQIKPMQPNFLSPFPSVWKTVLLLLFLLVYTVLIKTVFDENTSAALKWINDKAPVFTKKECPFSENSYGIYFIELQKEDGLSLREACAVESAAILHPTREINLLHTKPFLTLNNHTAAVFSNRPNVRVSPLHLSNLFAGTPLHEWHQQDRINASFFRLEHMSDAARLAVLWRCGGIYADTDAISIRSLNGLHNVIGFSSGQLASGLMIFDRGHPFLEASMKEFAKTFNPNQYDANGPSLVSRVMRSLCSRSDLSGLVNRPNECRGITIMEESAFYPFEWMNFEELFKIKPNSNVDLSKTLSVHLYGKMSRSKFAVPGELSFLENVAERYCPGTFAFMNSSNSV